MGDLQTEPIISVSEIFGPTIQGEGSLIGSLTIFVRTGGCDYRCDWCDTLYAVLPEYKTDWQPMTATEIFRQIRTRSHDKPILITLSGGNPAMQPLHELIVMGQEQGYTFACETQGTLSRPDWFPLLDYLILSPKPPSSLMKFNPRLFERCIKSATGTNNNPDIILKIVVFDDVDYEFAKKIYNSYRLPLYLQAGNATPPHKTDEVDKEGIIEKTKWLTDKVYEDKLFECRVLPQLHTLLWGNERGI